MIVSRPIHVATNGILSFCFMAELYATGASQAVLVVKNLPANAGDVRELSLILEFCPWVEKIPWRRAWQPTPVFLPGESHGHRSLAGYNPQGCKESDTTKVT